MHYLQSYRFVFKSHNWVTNLMFAILCSFIPIIGPIVMIGYLFEVIETLLGLHRWPQRGKLWDRPPDAFSEQIVDVLPANAPVDSEAYPDFTFDRFSEYLTRGIWPFLVRFLLGLPAAAILFVCWMMAMIGMGVAGAANSGAAVAILFVFLALVYFVVVLLMGVVARPIYLRAGLSGDFGSAFSMTFLRDFLTRVGKEVVLAELFITASSFVLTVVGLSACYIGIFPAVALIMFAQHHLDFQLYQLYLERGGVPVERREDQSLQSRFQEQDEPRSTHVMRPKREHW